MAHPIEHRYEFVLLFDVENGNPNGDPDAGNLPRIRSGDQSRTGDRCGYQAKIRNYVEIVKSGEPGFDIYVREGAVARTRSIVGRTITSTSNREEKKLPKDEEKARDITRFMCDNFYDIPHLWRCDDHQGELRSGARTGTDGLCPKHRSNRATRGHHYSGRSHVGGRRGFQEQRDGA